MEIGCFAFLRPLLGDLEQRTMIILGSEVDFLLVLIELFSLGVTAKELPGNIG